LRGLDRCFVLTPYDHEEVLTLAEAAHRARKTAGTIRNWCEGKGLGRRIGGTWGVSKIALEMYLDGDVAALDLYLSGDRDTACVVSYFNRFGLKPRKPVNS
jgi:hypothetical protein